MQIVNNNLIWFTGNEKKNEDVNECCDIIKFVLFIKKYNKLIYINNLKKKIKINTFFFKKKICEKINVYTNIINNVNSIKSQFQKPPHNNSWADQ